MPLLKLLVFIAAAAVSKDDLKDTSLLAPFPANPLLNEIIAFEPIEGHKFNLKANNTCGNGRQLEVSEKKVECQMYAAGTSQLELYVCDAAKTYCRREEVKIKTQGPQGLNSWLSYYKNTLFSRNQWATPYKSDVSHNKPVRNFIHNDLKQAQAQAKKEKKRLLVYVTQSSCPPCRLQKELTFSADEFQDAVKDMVRLQMDLDVELEAAAIKSWHIQSTPTVIVFNKDMQELERQKRVLSPAGYKSWLAQIPDTPIEKLVAMDPAKLSDAEKLRLSKWHYFGGGNEDGESEDALALATVKTIQNKDTETAFWIQMMEAQGKKNPSDAYEILKSANLAGHSPMALLDYAETLGWTLYKLKTSQDKKLVAKIVALADPLEKQLNDVEDQLQKSFILKELYSFLHFAFESQQQVQDVKKINKKMLQLVERFPKLPGVTETPQLDIIKADASGDPALKQKVIAEQKEKNKDDYAYDFWEGYDLLKQKKYEQALASAESSLAVAKDLNWQKAFILKMDILQAMKRQTDALSQIEDLLAKMKLPETTDSRVHVFVQKLRAKQASLKAPPAA